MFCFIFCHSLACRGAMDLDDKNRPIEVEGFFFTKKDIEY